jgi:hypothetical protein
MFEFGKTGYLLNELSLYSTTGLFTKTQSAEDATGPKVAGTIFFDNQPQRANNFSI